MDSKVDEGSSIKSKLAEYKKHQGEMTQEMQSPVEADETWLITAKILLDLVKWSKEIFMRLKLDEKRQLLKFLFSNLKLDGKKLVVTPREPFSTLLTVSHQLIDLRM